MAESSVPSSIVSKPGKNFFWLWLLVALVGFNILVSFWRGRIDLTTEKKFTLTRPVKQMLDKVPEEVEVDVFLQGNLKSGLRKLRNSTEELLQEFSDYSGGNIRYRFVDPVAGQDDSARSMILDSFNRMGIQPMTQVAQAKQGDEQSQRIVLPAAMIRFKDRHFPVDLLAGVQRAREGQPAEQLYVNAENLLEYKFANAIDKLVRDSLPAIGYVMGNGEPLDFRVYHLIQYLRENYRFGVVRLDSVPAVPDDFQALFIVKPETRFSDAEKLKLDQYVMRGGSLICLIDNLHAESDSLQASQQVVAYDRGLNLDDLFFRYGARLNQDLVEDMQSASINLVVGSQGGKPQFQLLPWPYYPLLDGNGHSPVTRNLDPVFSRFANSIDTVKAAGIEKSVLLQSSANARTVSTPAMISLETIKIASDPKQFDKQFVPVAVLLEGKFKSLYANRMSPAAIDSLARTGKPFLASGLKPARIVLCADADVVMNEVGEQGPMPLGFNKDINYTFANSEFLSNVLEYCVNPSGILAARSKEYSLRLLDAEKTEDDKTFWQLVNIGGPLLVIFVSGFLFQLLRKKRYALPKPDAAIHRR